LPISIFQRKIGLRAKGQVRTRPHASTPCVRLRMRLVLFYFKKIFYSQCPVTQKLFSHPRSLFSRFSFWKGHHVSPKFRKGLSPKFHKNLLRLISPFFIVLSFSFSDSFVLFYCCAIRRLSYSVQFKLQ